MIKKKMKACLLGLLVLAAAPVQAQDLIARQAPIDRKLKSVDSVALQRLFERERELDVNYARELYPGWNNRFARSYDVVMPDSFRIDLRGFYMPTDSRRITSNFGYRRAFRRQHEGLDIKVYIGDTIRSAFDGKVRVVRYDRGGYGYYVVIRHPNGLETLYGHLSKQLVDEDQIVKAGEPIGLGGNTGLSTGSHLHFETRFLGRAINPVLMFDFPNQDVTGDFFVFRKDGDYDRSLASDGSRNESSRQDGAQTLRLSGHFYKVKSGETLSSTSDKLGISVDMLCKANRLTTRSKIRPGQVLRY